MEFVNSQERRRHRYIRHISKANTVTTEGIGMSVLRVCRLLEPMSKLESDLGSRVPQIAKILNFQKPVDIQKKPLALTPKPP